MLIFNDISSAESRALNARPRLNGLGWIYLAYLLRFEKIT